MFTQINSPTPIFEGIQRETVIYPKNSSAVLISHLDKHFVLPDKFSNFSEKRKCEFLAGRYCAIRCLEKLGTHTPELSISSSRHPIWPEGFVGSISHTKNLATAAVASTDSFKGIGIDTEYFMGYKLALEIVDQILTQKEKENFSIKLMGQKQVSEFLSLVFSAKESIFKCYQPITKKDFYFHDAEITSFDYDNNVFYFRLLIDLDQQYRKRHENYGYYEIKSDYVHTTVLIENNTRVFRRNSRF